MQKGIPPPRVSVLKIGGASGSHLYACMRSWFGPLRLYVSTSVFSIALDAAHCIAEVVILQ